MYFVDSMKAADPTIKIGAVIFLMMEYITTGQEMFFRKFKIRQIF